MLKVVNVGQQWQDNATATLLSYDESLSSEVLDADLDPARQVSC